MTKEGSEAHPGKEKRFRTIEGWIGGKKKTPRTGKVRERERGGGKGGERKRAYLETPSFLRQSN